MPDRAGEASQQRIAVSEFRTNLAEFLSRVRGGASFLIVSRDEVVAEIGPPPAAVRPQRRPGALKGKIHMAPDFDTLPPDVLAAMEGEEE